MVKEDHPGPLPRGEGELYSAVGQHRANRRLERLERGNGKSSTRVIKTRRHDLALHGGSSLPITFPLDTVGIKVAILAAQWSVRTQLTVMSEARSSVRWAREPVDALPA